MHVYVKTVWINSNAIAKDREDTIRYLEDIRDSWKAKYGTADGYTINRGFLTDEASKQIVICENLIEAIKNKPV